MYGNGGGQPLPLADGEGPGSLHTDVEGSLPARQWVFFPISGPGDTPDLQPARGSEVPAGTRGRHRGTGLPLQWVVPFWPLINVFASPVLR